MKVGDHELQKSGRVDTNVEGKTPSNEASVGEFQYYRLTGPKGLDVELAYVTWANGERDVQVTRAKEPAILSHLEGRRRLALMRMPGGEFYAVLKQARVKSEAPNEWSGLFKASKDELDAGAKLDVHGVLKQCGAVRVGPKETVTGISDRQDDWPTAVFTCDDRLSPVVAFTVTRVLPLVMMYRPQLRLS